MSEYAKLLVEPRLVQILIADGMDEIDARAAAKAITAASADSTAKLSKGEVTLTFELMPSDPPAPSTPDEAPVL